jgi:hypothetical protein
VLVLLPITGLLRIVVSGRWEGARGFWRLRPSGGRRGAIANDSIGGKGLVLEAAVPLVIVDAARIDGGRLPDH